MRLNRIDIHGIEVTDFFAIEALFKEKINKIHKKNKFGRGILPDPPPGCYIIYICHVVS